MPRQTADVVALLLALILTVVTIATAIAVLYVVVTHPEQDVSRAAEAIGRIVAVITAALVGYMAGRRVNGQG